MTRSDVAITATGVYLPRTTHTYETLPPLDHPLDPDQIDRLGVRERHWAQADETVEYMAVQAAQAVLTHATLDPASIELLILANWSQRRYIPDLAPKVAHQLGAHRAAAFDIGCACAGFIYGLGIADSMLRTGRITRALVVSSDTSTQRIRPGSRASFIFADAAAAMALQTDAPGSILIDYELRTDNSQNDLFNVTPDGHPTCRIPQRDLNAYAGRMLAQAITAVLDRNSLTLDDIAWIVPHSGTAGVQAMLTQALGVPTTKILTNFPTVGNVASSSIPVALHHFLTTGTINPGDLVVSASVGVGFFSAAALYRI